VENRGGGGDGAQAGNEFDAVSVATFFGFAQRRLAIGRCGRRGSTARGEIEIVNVDEAKLVAVGGRKFAEAEAGCFVASDEADIDGRFSRTISLARRSADSI